MSNVSHQHPRVAITMMNPAGCMPHACRAHDHGEPTHTHGPGCGHVAVVHGDHVDYCVGDHLHHPHDGHCDDHGPIEHTA